MQIGPLYFVLVHARSPDSCYKNISCDLQNSLHVLEKKKKDNKFHLQILSDLKQRISS